MSRTIILLFLTIPLSCSTQDNFWTINEIDLLDNQEISTILALNSDEMFIGGTNKNGKPTSQKYWSPFIKEYSNKYRKDSIVTQFDCNSIYKIYKKNSFIVLDGIGRNEVYNTHTKYLYKDDKKKWQKIKLPDPRKDFTLYEITDDKSYLCVSSINQFGLTFYKTQDGGETWIEKIINMPNKRDGFWDLLYEDGKLWGVRKKYSSISEEVSLLYIDSRNWGISPEIDLSKNENVVEIKYFESNIYLLTQIGQKGFIKRVNQEKNDLEIISEFSFLKSVNASAFYLYKDYQIVITTDLNTFFPKLNLLYREGLTTKWQNETFPKHTNIFSFNNGCLLSVSSQKKIYKHDFN
ncbi:MAG: hypothetical protein WC121_10870 [Candidatus Kapaibacterium sp.]